MNAQFEPPTLEVRGLEPPKFRYVFFRRQPNEDGETGFAKIGTQSFRIPRSKYWGTVADGSSQKPVFPSSYIVEEKIAQLEKKDSEGPWYLPVFVQETVGALKAYAIHDEEYNIWQGKWCAKSEQARLEKECRDLKRKVDEIYTKQVSQRVAIFIDYQNFYKTLKERNFLLGTEVEFKVEDVVDAVCRWPSPLRMTEKLGDETLVFLFDYFHPGFMDLYTAWQFKGYQFIRIEPARDGTNPTDLVIFGKAISEIERLKDSIDVFCVVSGDKRFHEVLSHARSLGIKTLVASFAHNTAKQLYIVADYFCDLDLFFPKTSEVKCRCINA